MRQKLQGIFKKPYDFLIYIFVYKMTEKLPTQSNLEILCLEREKELNKDCPYVINKMIWNKLKKEGSLTKGQGAFF